MHTQSAGWVGCLPQLSCGPWTVWIHTQTHTRDLIRPTQPSAEATDAPPVSSLPLLIRQAICMSPSEPCAVDRTQPGAADDLPWSRFHWCVHLGTDDVHHGEPGLSLCHETGSQAWAHSHTKSPYSTCRSLLCPANTLCTFCRNLFSCKCYYQADTSYQIAVNPMSCQSRQSHLVFK